ncbi:hypothetical protein ACI65C_006282 [Semiaphis heraclei]
MSDEKMKRLRAPNITEEEKAIILYCISKEKHMVECKKTDKFNNREKNDAWERITLSFNSNQSVNKRDTKCLRRFWEGEKSKSRQGFVIERQERMLTGSGPQTTSYLDTTPEVNEIIQPRIDPQIVEIQNIYDGDIIEFTTEELSPLNDSVVYLSDSIHDNPGEYVVRTSTETNFSTYRIVNSDQNINSENCYKETDQILQSSNPRPHKSTVENDPLHNAQATIIETEVTVELARPLLKQGNFLFHTPKTRSIIFLVLICALL